MRQTLKERRKQLQRGTPMPRLFTMMLMLAIMGMIFVRLRDPNTWSWFVRDGDDQIFAENASADGKQPLTSPSATPTSGEAPQGSNEKPVSNQKPIDSGKTPTAGPAAAVAGKVAPPKAASPSGASPKDSAAKNSPPKDSTAPPAELTPTGPTDLDPYEWEDSQISTAVIKDGTTEMADIENPAYFQVLSWVGHQPVELLRKRAKKDVTYSDFRKTPDSMRLQIVELKLHVLQIVGYTTTPENGITQPLTTDEGKPLYEVRGFTKEGSSNLYIGVVTDLPKGMPIGTSIDEDARLVGYFFKLQGYFSRVQQLEYDRTGKRPMPLKAPMILGRLIWTPAAVRAEEKVPFWLLVTIGSVAAVCVIGWVLLTTQQRRRPILPAVTLNEGLEPEAPSVDNWLDQAQSGRLTLEPVPERTARSDGAALDSGFRGRWSGNIIGENDESSNGHGTHNGDENL